MIKKEVLKRILRDFHLQESYSVLQRDIDIPIEFGKIVTLVGVRRCGKTSILYDIINKISSTAGKAKVIFINFEDERLDFSAEDLELILSAYSELYPDNKLSDCFFFFDEIQNVSGWEKFVRRVYDTVSKNIFITGSNSKLLSSEIATSLRGRTLTFEVFPLSFKEFLKFKNIDVDLHSSRQLAYIKNAMGEYLKYGGFPEAVRIDKKYIYKLIQEYFDVVLYKDLVERYGIANTSALKFFLKRILASTTKQISIHKIYNELKSSGFKIGKNSLYQYMDYARSVYLGDILQRYDRSIVNREMGEKKFYSIDVGLNNALEYRFSDDIGKALENIIFWELRRRFDGEIFYFRSNDSECDFVIMDRGRVADAIQVCYDLNDYYTRRREIEGLLDICKKSNLKSGSIITYDTEEEIYVDNIYIKIVPFYKYALR
ncbi:ATP-binding protein [Flexistipes sinusarabici]|uniref:ATP-binding protein n=1 Tax=Flexistipes sinusarabici TaxID=2352 RepID=UPI0026EE2D78|nr:ATP-binding protein [Flexistipes sinusarabici]